jgi:hypothetical protein
MGLFLGVAEGKSIVVRRSCRIGLELARPGKDRKIAIQRAAGAAQMGQTEAIDFRFVIEVPAVRACIRTPLHHAEWQRCSWKGITISRRADKWVDRIIRRLCLTGRWYGERACKQQHYERER